MKAPAMLVIAIPVALGLVAGGPGFAIIVCALMLLVCLAARETHDQANDGSGKFKF